jgi:hypothetical protein
MDAFLTTERVTFDKLGDFVLSNARKVRIIGFCGHLGAGKTYFANKLTEFLSTNGEIVVRVSFASYLKKAAYRIWGIRKAYLDKYIDISEYSFGIFSRLFNEANFNELFSNLYYGYPNHHNIIAHAEEYLSMLTDDYINNNKNNAARKILQYLGTELFRAVDEDFHVKKIHEYLTDLQIEINPFTAVIDDVRFVNEANYVSYHNGIVVKVNRPIEKRALALNKPVDVMRALEQHDSEKAVDAIVPHFILDND